MCGEHNPTCRSTRRAFLASAAASSAALAGCVGGISGGGGGAAPDPITLTDEHTCDACGMVIPMHPGPTAQIFYRENRPEGHDNPARFCSAWESFAYRFEHDEMGWNAEAFYVTDYSSVDYSLNEEGKAVYVSSHPAAEAHVNAEELVYVVGSEAKSSMGGDLFPFSVREDATVFVDDHGGEIAAYDDITPELIGQLARS